MSDVGYYSIEKNSNNYSIGNHFFKVLVQIHQYQDQVVTSIITARRDAASCGPRPTGPGPTALAAVGSRPVGPTITQRALTNKMDRTKRAK